MKKINIVLYQPEIPQNTGNIIRTCVGTNAKLHLIKPLGFKFDKQSLKRYAVNYIDKLEYELYEDYNDFFNKNKDKGKFYYITRYGKKTYNTIEVQDDVYFIFGKESTGIDYHILKDNLSDCYRIPINDKIRALNLSNSVCIILFNYLEKINFEGLSIYEPESLKGKDFLNHIE